ncbi:eIF-2-alpha kinase GCN2 isoform X2 [Lutzomyia longipalpis]|uniref:eIF-2-alpha kinase GCN2 isoform X2 n=1 Tax=Lutzomyia longipalpis TaxID=7200 RepID=UPI0024840F98|nr:eIF-2-alpha kinase GCN2 isoform X2 [Lutzomyia longipalpis]
MASRESNRERQENEFEAIQSIFGVDVEDLREKGQGWKPMDFKLKLMPLKGSSGPTEAHVWTSVHITCPAKYPKVPPKLALEDSKGLSDALIEDLLKCLQKQAAELKGSEMVYELAESVRAFLFEHNKPPPGSFYDEMLMQKLKRDQERINCQKMKEDEEQQALKDEVNRRKEILKNESRMRKDTRRSISESSPNHGTPTSSDVSESSWPHFRSYMYPNECKEHRKSEVIYFHGAGRQIQKGCCLGHSQKGCVAYSGIDLETGQLVYLTEWNIKYSRIESKNNVDEIISNIEKQVTNLSQLRHKNLISYECVLCMKKKEGILVYLVQDFVLGTSICTISGTLGWCSEGASMVAKGVLDAIIFLHNNSVFHNHLLDTTVFMDNTGTIRVTDFALVPYLQDLIGCSGTARSDLPAMGALLEALLPTHTSNMRDYIERCKSDRTLSAVELQTHPFLQPILFNETAVVEYTAAPVAPRELRPELHSTISATAQSRLKSEFELLQFLGNGAYGDVLKVRNILDNRQYAIKRIPLTARNKQLYRKIRREVELLSRLNHENVVRYYNSWIETGLPEGAFGEVNIPGGDFSVSVPDSKNPAQIEPSDESSSESSDWINYIPPAGVDPSDGIEFVNSAGECVELEDFGDESLSKKRPESRKSPHFENQFMYIQMEFCEKSTLRTAIDGGLCNDTERLWRLFREIAEGLSHIHQQGMIHRDLKPVNIFLDSRDQVKIGDFGLATTSFLALQSQEQNASIAPSQSDMGDTLTGRVGTALYVAPELTGNASKSTYNLKVDLYSLGIILFEMSIPPFETAMERVKTIVALRSSAITFPDFMMNDKKYSQHVNVIKWLLDHDPSKRPSSEELLTSDLVPPARLEATELQEMLRNVLANPQSRTYKHLVSRCLSQESNKALELTYHLNIVPISTTMGYVKGKILHVFKRHGAIEVITPLLTPLGKDHTYVDSVKLMTHSGNVVYLPYDLRQPFASHVAVSGITSIRRYSIGRVYREKKVFNFHPKQLYECAFDIISQDTGNFLLDAEIISVSYEISMEFTELREKNLSFRLNHTTLLRAILMHCNVPKEKQSNLLRAIQDFMECKITKFQLTSAINSIFATTKHNTNTLIDLLVTESPLGGPRGSINGSALRSLVKGRGEAAALAKGAIRELESVVQLVQGMGVTCPMILQPGLSAGFNRARSGGIVWQMVADLKKTRKHGPDVLAGGGRYDDLLADFQKIGSKCRRIDVPAKNICGVGFSFAMDKMVNFLGLTSTSTEYRSLDVVICVLGSRPPLQDVTQILHTIWSMDIKCGVVEASQLEEAEQAAEGLGAAHVIVLGEGGTFRVRSWDNKIFRDQQISRPDLMEYLHKIRNPPETNFSESFNSSQMNTSASSTSLRSNSAPSCFSNVEVQFITMEKMANHAKKRLENYILQIMASSLKLFVAKERIRVYAVDLPLSALGLFVGTLEPRNIATCPTEEEIPKIIESRSFQQGVGWVDWQWVKLCARKWRAFKSYMEGI